MKSILFYFLLCLSILLLFLCFLFNSSSPFFSSTTSIVDPLGHPQNNLQITSSPRTILFQKQSSATVQIGLMGDLGLGRMITRIARQKNDFSYSFSGVSNWLLANDFNIANLESAITPDCPTLSPTTFFFCGDSKFLPQLSQHKFVLNLANNHILNFGQSGLAQTQQFLTNSQIPFFYSHQPQTEFIQKTVNSVSFGFLGFDLTGNHQFSQADILDLVEQLDSQVDWLIISLHWGAEYLPQAEKWRVTLARQLIDRGADIIHGHHPHVWQPPETYKDKLIYYSFGNFIFDQNWSSATSHSNIIRLTLTKNKIIKQQIFPIEIQNNSRPVIITTSDQ